MNTKREYVSPLVEVEKMDDYMLMVGSRKKPGHGYGDNNHDHKHQHDSNDENEEDRGYALEMENIYIW